MKCIAEGCEATGEPQEGFDFFVCDRCFEELERCLHREAMQRIVERN